MAVRKRKDIYQWALFCWILALYIQMVHPQYCKPVYEEFVHCNSSTDFLITCPESHMIEISFAYPMQLPQNTACINDVEITKSSCNLESLGYFYRTLCSGQRTCLIPADTWNRLEIASCLKDYGGSKLIHMQYRCTLGTTSVSVLNLCNVDITATSYVRLISSLYSDMIPSRIKDPSRPFYSSPCTCRMTLPGNSEMILSRESYWKSQPGYDCDQRVVVETSAGVIVAAFCSNQKVHQFISCKPEWRDFVIRYETKDPSVNVSFIIDFSVFHEVGFKFECGINLRTPEPPTTTTSVSTTTTTIPTTETQTTTTATSTTATESTITTTQAPLTTIETSTTTQTTTFAKRTPTTATSTTTVKPTTPTTKYSKTIPPKFPPPPQPIQSESAPTESSDTTLSPIDPFNPEGPLNPEYPLNPEDPFNPEGPLYPEDPSEATFTTKRTVAPNAENDVSNIIESSDVRIDNTRGSTDGKNGEDGGDGNLLLPIEAIIGIAVGSVMFLIFLIIVASCFSRNKKDQSVTTEQVSLDLSFKDDPIYEEPKYYATSYDNPDLYPNGKKSFKTLPPFKALPPFKNMPPGLPPRNSNLYAEPPSSTSSGSMRRSRLDDFRSRSVDFSIATVSSAPYLSAKKISPPTHPHVIQAFAPAPPLPMRTMSPPLHVRPPPLQTLQTSTLPTERYLEMAPLSPMSHLRGTHTTPAPSGRGKSPVGPKTKPKPTKLPTKKAQSSDRHMNTNPPPRHYKHHIEPSFSATAPDRHEKKRQYRRQQSASPPRVHFNDNSRSHRLPDVLSHGSDTVQNPIFGYRDSHDTFFAY